MRGPKYCSSISVGPTTGQAGYRLSRSASVPFCVASRLVFVLPLFCVAEVSVCEVLAGEARCALEICIWVSRDWLAQRGFIFCAMASGSARPGGTRLAKLLYGNVNSYLSSGAAGINGGGAVWGSTTGLSSAELAPFGARSASGQIVRNRMKSVKSIQKITKAMKMVAASKLRNIQVKAENSRGLWQPFTALLGDAPATKVDKKLIVTISSDKGLCGGINSTVVKYSRALFRLNGLDGPDKDVKYVIVGEKGKAQLQRDSKKLIGMYFGETQKSSICFTQCSMMADEIIKSNEYDAIQMVYNKFNSVVSFQPTVATMLSPQLLLGDQEVTGDLDAYEIEGSDTKEEVLQNLSEFQFACTMYNAMLENATSEMGARMSAMENSTRNASDMLDRLTLTYNRSRQASITTELIEIISGAAALEG